MIYIILIVSTCIVCVIGLLVAIWSLMLAVWPLMFDDETWNKLDNGERK